MTPNDQHKPENKERAQTLFNNKQFGEAISIYEKICASCPEDQDSWMMQGLCFQAIGNLDKAISCLEQADNIEPPSAEILAKLGMVYIAKQMIDLAMENFKEALEIQADHEESRIGLGSALLMLERYQEAMEHCQVSLKFSPDSVELRSQLAVSLEQLNRLEEAKEAAKEALAKQPDHPRASFTLAKIDHRLGNLESARLCLAKLLNTKLPPHQYSAIAAELGRVLDKMGDYQEAFKAYTAGNMALATTVKTDQVNVDELFETIELYQQWFSAETTLGWLEAAKDLAEDRPTPIFLVGFPRSGTTLTEQIIVTGDNIVSSNEQPIVLRLISELSVILERPILYPPCLEELSLTDLQKLRDRYWQMAKEMVPSLGEQDRLLDKLPLNIIELGFIYRLFPKAKIVVVLRDPRDVCLNCFMHAFVLNQAMINFLDLERTAKIYASTMALWLQYRSFFKFPYIELRYENLTNDTETESKKLAEFLNLEWNDRSSTPQPVSRQDTGQWLHYRNQMVPVMKTLQPYVKEFTYEEDAVPPGMMALPTLPDHIKQAFTATGGVGCSFALLPIGEEKKLCIVSAIPEESRQPKGTPIKLDLDFEVHAMTNGVVLQIIISAEGLFEEKIDLDIILNPHEPQQAAILDQIAEQEQVGIFFYDASGGQLLAGNEVIIDDIKRGDIEKIQAKIQAATNSITQPVFQAAVAELTKKLTS